MTLPRFTALYTAMQARHKSDYKQLLARGVFCSAVLTAALPVQQVTAADANLQQNYRWNIPAQPLNVSITDLAERAGLVILLPPEQFSNVNASALRGDMTVTAALEQLLDGTGYTYQVDNGNTLILREGSSDLPLVRPESMVVTGNWLDNVGETTVHEFPGARNILTAEEIEKSGASSLTEAFRKIPGVQVRIPSESYGANHALSVGVRGLKSRFSEKSTILLDGMPLAFAPYGQPQLSIAPVGLGNLAAIDVVKGGSSVRYGPQNVGGIINFVTPEIPEELTTRLKLRTEGAVDDGRGGMLGQTNLFIGGATGESTGLALMYSGSHGSSFRENSDESIDDLMIKAETWLDDKQKLEGHIRRFQAETDIAGGLNEAQYAEDRYQSRYDNNHFDGDRTEARVKYTNFISDTQEFEVQAFASNTARLYGLQFNPDNRQRYDEWDREYDVYGVEPRYSQVFEAGDTEHEVSVGYRFIKEEADLTRHRWNGFAAGSDPRTVAGVLRTKDKAGTTAHAVYVDDRISFGDWIVTPGVRVEDVEVFRDSKIRKNVANDFRNEQSYTEVLPSLSASYLLSPEVTLFANYNTSFGTLQHLQLADTTDNDLEPEIAKTIELGSRYQKGGLSAELTLFNINFDNKLQWDDTLEHHVNKGETQHYGFEMAAAYAFENTGMSVYGNLAYTEAEFKDGDVKGNDLPYYSNWVGNLGMQYETGPWTYNLEAYAQSKQYTDNENTKDLTVVNDTYYRGEMPSFVIWNTRASYQFQPATRVSFGVKNLFNEKYYSLSGPDQPYGAGISPGAPTTAYLELEMEF
ncbi:TonB-dependent siderophore receptor [Aliamphritea hakodatensis]|uniref:TonB-dependent siderophore receptor n=1 Tax=Aliamphritea hakodatensis TaxID=2895352 RepID=UPI0022FDA10A|nr:TonB-dependent receptor [Aliamphritea hakodatensis]